MSQMDHLPKDRGEIKKILKPPTSCGFTAVCFLTENLTITWSYLEDHPNYDAVRKRILSWLVSPPTGVVGSLPNGLKKRLINGRYSATKWGDLPSNLSYRSIKLTARP